MCGFETPGREHHVIGASTHLLNPISLNLHKDLVQAGNMEEFKHMSYGGETVVFTPASLARLSSLQNSASQASGTPLAPGQT